MPDTRVFSSNAKHRVSQHFARSGHAARHRIGRTTARGAHSDAQEQAMNNASERIERGLKEALAQAQREEREGPVAIEKIDVPELDVMAIRASTGLTQAEFARSIGVDERHITRLGAPPQPAWRYGPRPARHNRTRTPGLLTAPSSGDSDT